MEVCPKKIGVHWEYIDQAPEKKPKVWEKDQPECTLIVTKEDDLALFKRETKRKIE